jgi:hypothetical protein
MSNTNNVQKTLYRRKFKIFYDRLGLIE